MLSRISLITAFAHLAQGIPPLLMNGGRNNLVIWGGRCHRLTLIGIGGCRSPLEQKLGESSRTFSLCNYSVPQQGKCCGFREIGNQGVEVLCKWCLCTTHG